MYSFESNIRYSETGAEGKLTLPALIDYFQDCSVFHSESRRVGLDFLAEHHIGWVVSFYRIFLDRMPVLAERVTTQTWAHGLKGFYGNRNFAMEDASGERLAYADSIWVLMDFEAGRPAKIPQEMLDAYEICDAIEMEKCRRKIEVPEVYEERGELIVPSFFIDSNRHMNNGKYLAVALEHLPEGFFPHEIRIEFRRSAMLGDRIFPRVTQDGDQITVVLAAEDGKPYAVLAFIRETY